MTDIDAILQELAEISERLDALPEGARDERAELQRRRDQLHTAARDLQPEDPAEMRAELRRLETLWESIRKDHIDVVKQAGDVGSGGAFGFTADAMAINRAIDENAGKEEIESRIKYLKSRLAEIDG